MRVTIAGPNLPRPLADRGDMHVHAAGCRDLSRYPTERHTGEKGWTIEVAGLRELTLEVYGDQIAESDDPTDWQSYLEWMYVAPCVRFGAE